MCIRCVLHIYIYTWHTSYIEYLCRIIYLSRSVSLCGPLCLIYPKCISIYILYNNCVYIYPIHTNSIFGIIKSRKKMSECLEAPKSTPHQNRQTGTINTTTLLHKTNVPLLLKIYAYIHILVSTFNVLRYTIRIHTIVEKKSAIHIRIIKRRDTLTIIHFYIYTDTSEITCIEGKTVRLSVCKFVYR